MALCRTLPQIFTIWNRRQASFLRKCLPPTLRLCLSCGCELSSRAWALFGARYCPISAADTYRWRNGPTFDRFCPSYRASSLSSSRRVAFRTCCLWRPRWIQFGRSSLRTCGAPSWHCSGTVRIAIWLLWQGRRVRWMSSYNRRRRFWGCVRSLILAILMSNFSLFIQIISNHAKL